MIRLSPPNYSYVQVERPVIEGARTFLAKAQHVGNWVLGQEIVGSIPSTSIDMSAEDPTMPEIVHVHTPIGTPMFETSSSNDLSLVLLHRGIRSELNSRYGLLQAYRTLRRRTAERRYETVIRSDGKEDRAEITHPPLYKELEDISRDYDLDPAYTKITCDRVDIIGEPGGNYVLGLFVSPGTLAARALHDQAKESANRLIDNKLRLARTTSPWQVAIPFGRFPSDIDDSRYQRLFEALNDVLPVDLMLGEPKVVTY